MVLGLLVEPTFGCARSPADDSVGFISVNKQTFRDLKVIINMSKCDIAECGVEKKLLDALKWEYVKANEKLLWIEHEIWLGPKSISRWCSNAKNEIDT